jgi:predicted transposase YbfD/YdcC
VVPRSWQPAGPITLASDIKPLLAPLNLTGWAVTLDALHCQRETARYLVEDKNAA